MNNLTFHFLVIKLWFAKKNPMYELFFKGKKVLDVGCGEGALLKLEPKNFYGIDINDTLLTKLSAEGLNAKKGSVTNIPFESGTFDAVQCSNIIEHLNPAEAHTMLLEIARVLRNGGYIILTTPMPKTIWNTFGHIKPYSPTAIKKILRPVSLESFDSISGLHIEHVLYYGVWGSSKFAFLVSSLFALAFDPFRGSYTMVLRKQCVQ